MDGWRWRGLSLWCQGKQKGKWRNADVKVKILYYVQYPHVFCRSPRRHDIHEERQKKVDGLLAFASSFPPPLTWQKFSQKFSHFCPQKSNPLNHLWLSLSLCFWYFGNKNRFCFKDLAAQRHAFRCLESWRWSGTKFQELGCTPRTKLYSMCAHRKMSTCVKQKLCVNKNNNKNGNSLHSRTWRLCHR